MIFKDKETNTRKLCSKAWSLTLEAIFVKILRKIDIADLCVEERNFIGYLLDKRNRGQSRSDISSQHNNYNYSWKLRMKDEEFSIWLKNCNTHYLFFDGASKSNPGMAGASKIICNANGDIKFAYEWGLVPLSNNRDEALALYQGLIQLQKLGIITATILGDSAIIISLMVYNWNAFNVTLQQIINRCQALTQQMKEVCFFHVLHSLNKEVDSRANRAYSKSIENLRCNATESQCYLSWTEANQSSYRPQRYLTISSTSSLSFAMSLY